MTVSSAGICWLAVWVKALSRFWKSWTFSGSAPVGIEHGTFFVGNSGCPGATCSPSERIAGSVLRLNNGVWNVWTNSSIPLWECVNCASLNPATAIGLGHKKGSLEVGKDADIVILDNEFNVQKTIIKGEKKYEIKG